MNIKNIEYIFIDWNGTLSTSKFWGNYSDPKHRSHHIWNSIQENIFINNKTLLDEWMRGKTTTENVIKIIATELQVNYLELLLEFINSVKNMKFVSDEIIPIIKKLRSINKKVLIATDNMDSFTRWTIPSLELGYYFDDILNSSNMKTRKSDFINNTSLFFEPYINKHKINKSTCLLIDDSDNHKEKFEKYGIQFLHIQPGELLTNLHKLEY